MESNNTQPTQPTRYHWDFLSPAALAFWTGIVAILVMTFVMSLAS